MKQTDNAAIGARIRGRREQLNLSLTEVAESVAVAVSTVQRYETGQIENLKLPVLESIARVLGVETGWLLGQTEEMVRPQTVRFPLPRVTEEVVTFPVIGEVAAGYEHLAQEVWDGETVDIPAAFLRGRPRSDYFVLKVCGNSMYPLYIEGDRVLVLRTDTLDHSGQIGLILYNDSEATLKKVEYAEGEDWMRLVPVNPEYEPRLIRGEALAHCRVLGVPRLLIREIDSL